MSTGLFEFINPRYILGLGDDPKQLLQPIAGYAHEPLLTLEEACEPLQDIVSRLPAHIWIAKKNSKNPSDGLTQDESAAIHLYTMEWDTAADEIPGSLYVHLNRTLKQVDRMKLRPWFRYLKLFLTALAKLPPAPRQTVWRGVRKDHSADYTPGEEVTWWAFSSCTTSLSVLESELYLGTMGTRTLFSIETINGRTVRSHSHFKTEDEILLLPGTFLEVRSRLNPATDLYIIHLQQKIPPYTLLEPPFEGAELFSSSEIDQPKTRDAKPHRTKEIKPKPFYKKTKIRFTIGAIFAAIIIAVVLGAVLGTRKTTETSSSSLPPPSSSSSSSPPTLTTTTTTSNIYNGSIPNPPSVADAFYAFDDNMDDLYSQRNGIAVGGSVRYIRGYVAYGKAIVLDQSTPTQIHIIPAFNFTVIPSFTIQGFFMIQRSQLNATLLELTPNIMMNLTNGMLIASLKSDVIIAGTKVISIDNWHHLSFVYDAVQQTATLYIDGLVEATSSAIVPDNSTYITDARIMLGDRFQGCIDQLSITLRAKAAKDILWDATTAAYYRLDVAWLLDSGPNGLNASAVDVIPIYGLLLNALNFNMTSSYFQADHLTALGTPNQAFSISLWVRSETQPGVFLTISNPSTCLLVLGLQNNNNILVAYLPNSTETGESVNIVGPAMPNAWVNVIFTWSSKNRAQLYTSGYLQKVNGDTSLLNNARGGNNSLPMTLTLGTYKGPANCEGIAGVNQSRQFMGSIDEVYVFTRELQADDIKELSRS